MIHISKSISGSIVELYGFCDVSERVYGACIYLRVSEAYYVQNCVLFPLKQLVCHVWNYGVLCYQNWQAIRYRHLPI